MKQGTANLAEDYCFIHKALRPVSKPRRQIAAVPPANSRPGGGGNLVFLAHPRVSHHFPDWHDSLFCLQYPKVLP